MTEQNIDVAVIQETRLHPDTNTPQIPNYSFTRQDRPIPASAKLKTNGGGLITYIKDNLTFNNTASFAIPNIESQTTTIPLTKTKNLIVTNLYLPQNPSTNQQTVDANITTLFTRLTNIPNSLIAGDINAHSQLWHSPTADHRGDVIASLLQGSDHVVLNQDPYTRTASLLQGSDHVVLNQDTYTRTPSQTNQQLTSPDITSISSNLANQTTWRTNTSLSSDHLPIIININTRSNFRLKPSNKTFTNYKKANWNKFTEEIELSLLDSQTPTNVHAANKHLTNLILLADKHHIPKGRIKKLNQPLPDNIKDKIKERNRLRDLNPKDSRITPLSKEITSQIFVHRNEQWKVKLDQIGDHKKNSRTLWNTINYLGGKKPPLQANTVIAFSGKPAITPQQKASAFNKQFVNTVNHATKTSNRKINKQTKALPSSPIHITSIQVSEAISKSSDNNSTGPDHINIRHLKHLGPFAIQYLTDVLNLALNFNVIPQIWKLAKIIPIPKPNKDR